MAKSDVYEREMRYRAHALRELGFELPVKGKNNEIVKSSSAPTRQLDEQGIHAEVAKDRKNYQDIGSLLREHDNDPKYEVSPTVIQNHTVII